MSDDLVRLERLVADLLLKSQDPRHSCVEMFHQIAVALQSIQLYLRDQGAQQRSPPKETKSLNLTNEEAAALGTALFGKIQLCQQNGCDIRDWCGVDLWGLYCRVTHPTLLHDRKGAST